VVEDSRGGRPFKEIEALKQLEREVIEEEKKKGRIGYILKNTVINRMLTFVSYYTAQKYFYEIINQEDMTEQIAEAKKELQKRVDDAEKDKQKLIDRLKAIEDELNR